MSTKISDFYIFVSSPTKKLTHDSCRRHYRKTIYKSDDDTKKKSDRVY